MEYIRSAQECTCNPPPISGDSSGLDVVCLGFVVPAHPPPTHPTWAVSKALLLDFERLASWECTTNTLFSFDLYVSGGWDPARKERLDKLG